MPKPAPACATPVMEGMKVTTQTKRALDAQRNVMEFLLINHPLDCPICDQGGECELQDVSMGYGRSVSRYVDRKRVVPDEDLGPLVATDMTRCIQCTRCVRFTADIAGTYELGGMYRGEDLQIGTYDGKPLMSELSGNVIDVCPVGALTNKVFRFRARAWELTARESVGYHDALGSNLFLHVYRNQVLRTVPRDNEAVNECWLSDRDRYSHEGLYADDRATRPLVREGDSMREASWDEAIAVAAAVLRDSAADTGVLVHPSTGNEEGALLAALAAHLGTPHLDHRIAQHDLADDARAEAFQMPVADLEKAAVVLLVGCNLRHEQPLLHQRLFKAGKRGAKIFAVNPVDFDASFAWTGKRIVPPSRLAAELDAIGSGADDAARAIADALRAANGNAVVILGEIAENGVHASRIRAAAASLAQATGAKLDRIPQGANAVGLAQRGVLPGDGGRNASEVFANGGPANFVLYGIEPRFDFADATAALKALDGARVVAFSAFASESLRRVADVILPIGLVPEIETSLTNLDGRTQVTSAGSRLPGDAKAGWRVLRALGESLGAKGFDFTDLHGLRASMAPRAVPVRARSAVAVDDSRGLERIATTPIYRGDAVLRRAPALNAHPLTLGPRIALHPDDATSLGLADGAMAQVGDGTGTAMLPVAIDARVARGAAWIETNYDATAPISARTALGVAKVTA
jgi:NADH-quinone oxidoreductase subunit G